MTHDHSREHGVNWAHGHVHEQDLDGHGSHDHGHFGHTHPANPNADRRYLLVALFLLFTFMGVEVAVGLLASSLALVSDAGHMLTDAGAIAMSLAVLRLSQRPPGGRFTFGLRRLEIFSAQINGLTLVALSGWFLVEGIRRLVWPPVVEGLPVTWVALAGIVVNLMAIWAMGKANRESLNVEGSFQHILSDLYAFILTAAAGILIYWTHMYRLDALVALVVAGLMLRSGAGLLRESGRILLEAAPRGISPDTIGRVLAKDPEVRQVHDLHVWEVTSGFTALSAHILVAGDPHCHGECHIVRQRLTEMLAQRFGIHHVTLQVDHLQSEYRIPLHQVRRAMRGT